MPIFDELKALVPALKRAAIDAYVCAPNAGFLDEVGDALNWNFEIDGDYYSWTHTPSGGYGISLPTTYRIDRPGADGEGGGYQKIIRTLAPDGEGPHLGGEFDAVRAAIDEILDPFSVAPDPDKINTELTEVMRQVARRLALEAGAQGGSAAGAGDIGGNLDLALENSDAMSGGLITAFKANFLSQIGKAVGGQHAIAVILGGVHAAEEEIWRNARQGLLDIVTETTAAFDNAANDANPDWSVVLKILGWANSGVKLFAKGPGEAATGAIELGLEVLDAALPNGWGPFENRPEEGSYSSILAAFSAAVAQVATDIGTEEEVLVDNLGLNLGNVRNDKSSYDLDRPPVLDVDEGSDLGARSEIYIEPVLAKEITATYLPNVAEELFGAKGIAGPNLDFSPVYRDAAIGAGQYGPSQAYHPLHYLLWELLGNLGVEIKYSAKTLDLAIADLLDQDAGAAQQLAVHARQVDDYGIGESGSTYDPWN